jgi:hypothetical protein
MTLIFFQFLQKKKIKAYPFLLKRLLTHSCAIRLKAVFLGILGEASSPQYLLKGTDTARILKKVTTKWQAPGLLSASLLAGLTVQYDDPREHSTNE